jgi:hypothetical protein
MDYLQNLSGSCKPDRSSAPFQTDLFGTTVTSTALVGIEAVLPKACAGCGGNVVVLGSSRGPHFARLNCTACGSHRGWASAASCQFINTVIDNFGRPSEPIVIRRRVGFVTGVSSFNPGMAP